MDYAPQTPRLGHWTSLMQPRLVDHSLNLTWPHPLKQHPPFFRCVLSFVLVLSSPGLSDLSAPAPVREWGRTASGTTSGPVTSTGRVSGRGADASTAQTTSDAETPSFPSRPGSDRRDSGRPSGTPLGLSTQGEVEGPPCRSQKG